ncbi:MAG: Gfo/Idh/MocA family oxidoreductase [Planctomycetota bacterium]|nr:Gfo/Idh/MocA family oxidoreductase [Planctomycetota bacterium]
MSDLRVAVIGYGFAGRCFHSYLVGITPGLKLRGVASRGAETRQRIVAERKCLAYESFEQVLADKEVDLVVLATPNATHCGLAVRALEAGKHVVTDKAAALNLAEWDRMTVASARTGKTLSVFQNRRWDGDYLTLRSLIDQGKLGELRCVEMAWQGFGPWGGWRGQKEAGGGKLYDLGAHMVDQLAMLFPQAIESVYCRMHHDHKSITAESQALVVVGFAGGATGVCDTSSLAAIQKARFHAMGMKGTYQKFGFDPQEAAMIKGDIDASREPESAYGKFHDGTAESVVPTIAGRWRSYYENVRDVVVKGAEPAVRTNEVRRAIGVLDAAFESARTGQVVRTHLPPA